MLSIGLVDESGQAHALRHRKVPATLSIRLAIYQLQ